MHFLKLRVELTLPLTLIPVCPTGARVALLGETPRRVATHQFFCAAAVLADFGVRLAVSIVRVGQRPINSIPEHTNKINVFRGLKSHESLPSQLLKAEFPATRVFL